MERQKDTDRHTDRQTDRETERQTDTQEGQGQTWQIKFDISKQCPAAPWPQGPVSTMATSQMTSLPVEGSSPGRPPH